MISKFIIFLLILWNVVIIIHAKYNLSDVDIYLEVFRHSTEYAANRLIQDIPSARKKYDHSTHGYMKYWVDNILRKVDNIL